MLRVEKVTEQLKDLEELRRLYTDSFPANERHPFSRLLEDDGHMETLAFYDGELFCGFASLLCCKDIAHIVYFAVEEDLRGRGYGSAILGEIHRKKAGFRVIVDIERDDCESENREQRRKRKQFYLRNGYRETQVKYRWRQEDYEILSCGGDVTDADFEDFWRSLTYVI